SGVIQSIVIEGDRLSNKGKCLSSEGDKFLIFDEKGCYRSFCHRRDALPHLCSLITGDALLYSMFRENADPSCTEDSRLLLNYQACPDVHASESTAAGVEYRVAQSGDATCNGLFSATEGSRTISNYTFYQRNATLRIANNTGADIKVYCVNVKASSPSGNSVALVAHWQHHW
ncbi:Uncharacterized protein OBRU01_15874, partial [Operophtera brumata]